MVEKKLWFRTSLKNFNTFDVAILKFAIIAFTLFIVSAWTSFANWVINVHWGWFLVAWLLLAIIPIKKAWKK